MTADFLSSYFHRNDDTLKATSSFSQQIKHGMENPVK